VEAAYEKVTLKGKVGKWECSLDPKEEGEFRAFFKDMDELRGIRFPRCVVPKEGQFRKPLLMVFGYGSREACCLLVSFIWERDDSQVVC
jgi:hypothetical protein